MTLSNVFFGEQYEDQPYPVPQGLSSYLSQEVLNNLTQIAHHHLSGNDALLYTNVSDGDMEMLQNALNGN